MTDLTALLREIADGEPDAKLTLRQNAAVPALVTRGWLEVFGYSDGDYVGITEKGRRKLEEIALSEIRRSRSAYGQN